MDRVILQHTQKDWIVCSEQDAMDSIQFDSSSSFFSAEVTAATGAPRMRETIVDSIPRRRIIVW